MSMSDPCHQPARGIMSWVLTVAMVPAVATRTSSVPHVAIECSATSMPRMRCARICAVTSGGTVPRFSPTSTAPARWASRHATASSSSIPTGWEPMTYFVRRGSLNARLE